MRSIIGSILVSLIVIIIAIISALAHEADLSSNFKKTGDAKAWIFAIKK